MKPYVLTERMPQHIDKRYMTPNQRRRSSKKRRQEVRERRKHDKKQLRDKWEF